MRFLSGTILFFLFPYLSHGQCPTINTAMINACAVAPSTSEGINEFVYFSTTAAATAGDYTLSYGTVNPPLGGASSNILAGSNARTKNGPGSLTSSNGCVITYVTSPATVIPANSGVLLIPSNFDNDYDLTGVCSNGSLYAILVDINAAPSNTWGPGGTFANSSGANLRYLQISNGAANCSSNIVSYNGNGWPGSADGNSVWWDGTPNYQNNGCSTIRPPKPTITPDPIPAVCAGTPATMSFNTTGVPDKYSIDWNNAANTAGFIDVAAAPLPAFPITLTPPANVPAGTYTGILTVINSLTPDTSIPQNITVTVNPAPVITTQPSTVPQKVCQNGPVSSLNLTATAGSGTISGYQWFLYTVPGNASALPFATTNSFLPSSSVTPVPDTLYFYCTVTNSGGCSTVSDTAILIVNPNIVTPTASATQQPTCAVPTGTIMVTAPVSVNILYSNSGAAGPYQVSGTFANLAPGVSYNITARDTLTGCTSPVRTVPINALPAGPVVAASVTTQPTCAVPTGTITVSSPIGADYEYSVGGAYQLTTGFSGLAGSTTYNVTVRQISTGCVSAILALPVGPVAGSPARPDITVVHPVCTTPTGSITVTAPLNANYEYSTGGAYQTTVLFSNLVPGTNYSVTVRDISTGCISAPHDTTMNMIPALAPPVIATPLLFYCENETAPALTATGTNLQWYTSLTGGTASTTAPVPVTTTAGVFKFYVSQKNGVCESTRDSITVTVNAIPALPGIAGNTTTYCQNETATVLTATGTGLQWYNTATGGSALPGAPTPSTAAGNTTYYVTQTINGCESGRAPIAITVNAIPAAPDVSGNRNTYCKNDIASPLVPSGPQYLWYNLPSGGTGSTTVPVVPVATVNTFNFYVSETSNGCEGPRATVTITVNDIPAAPSVTVPAGYCQGSAAASLIAAGANLLWYTTPPPGTGSPTAPTPSTSTIGNTDYYVTQTVNGCVSPASTITVNISAQPPAPVTVPLTYCQNENAPALTATGTGLLWYTAATGGPGSSIAPTPSTSNQIITTYYVSQTVNGCESNRAALTVTVNAIPAPPSITTPIVQYCQKTTANPLTVTGTNVLWYTAPSGGTGSSAAPVVSTDSTGSTFHYVTQTINGCESGRDLLTVTIVAVPNPPVPVTPVDYCQNQLAAPVSANGIGLKWYSTLTSPTPLPSAPTPSTTTVTGIKYYVSQFINTCESKRDSIIVTIKPASPQPVVVSPLEYCQNIIAPALSATGSNLLWYSAATGGTGSSTAPVPSTTTPATTFFYVTQNANGCESTPRTAITVTVKVTSTAVTGFHYSSDAFCLNGVTPPSPFYDFGFTTGGTFTSTPAGLSINAATGDINLASSSAGTYNITYTYNTTGCVNGNTSFTTITLNPAIPSDARFSYSSPVCKDAAPVLPQTLPGFTTGGLFTSVPGTLSINSSTGEINVGNSPPGTYTVLYNVNEQGCRQARNGSSGIIIIDTSSPVTKFNYSSTDICLIAGAVNPTITKATGFTAGGTFTVTPAGLSVNSVTGDVNIGLSVAGTYIIKYSVPSLLCRYAGADSIVFKLKNYGAPVTGFSYVGPVCKGDDNAIPVMNTGFTDGGVFSSAQGLAVDATSGAIDLRQSVAGDYTVRYDVAQGVCNPADFGLANIKVLAQPEAPTVTSASVCGEGTVTLNAAALGTLSWYTDPSLLNQVFVGGTFSTFISTTTPFYVTNTVGSCESEPAVANAFAYPVPVKPYIGGDTSICANEKLVLNAGAYNSYLWQDGSTSRTYNVVNSGIYKVIVSTGIGCSDSTSIAITVLDDCTDIVFPNAFSPNGDVHNPTFGPWGNLLPVSKYALHIYNRYGQEVFAAADPSKKWDGTYKGKAVDIGAYIYVATYVYKNKINRVKKGTVMVIR